MSKSYILVFVFIFLFHSCHKHDNTYEINGFTMGTTYSIEIIETSLDTSSIKSDINKILNSKYNPTVINKIDNPRPKLKQTLTSSQLTAIAESYNRSLYEEIKKK